jgi:hypothetical protein
LEELPKLGDFAEIHEGVHSGNIRAELFVNTRLDDTCEELIFGRDEIAPYSIQWHGKFIRLGALPDRRSPDRYANAGSPEWHHREKLLVRRTGDHVLAAVDTGRRYASNNFFVVFPRRPGLPSLECLCALLNSRVVTAYFRAIEPRQGRVFSELKIKHLRSFPLPRILCDAGADSELLALATQRIRIASRLRDSRLPHDRQVAERECARLDEAINERVLRLFQLSQHDLDDLNLERHGAQLSEPLAGSGSPWR